MVTWLTKIRRSSTNNRLQRQKRSQKSHRYYRDNRDY